MSDKEILALLEWLEDEGYNQISQYAEDTQVGVCPCCKISTAFIASTPHESSCLLKKAIEELKARTNSPD